MLVKALLTLLFQRGIILLATSNYPPDQLLANPLYHERFVPSIALIKQHMTIAALNGEEDYRARHAPAENPFCRGRFLVQPSAQTRQRLELPDPCVSAQPLQVGYRTLHAASAPAHFLHFTFNQLCMAATSVMDYLALCERHERWLLDAVPPLRQAGPAAQQRFINLVDVLYEPGQSYVSVRTFIDTLRPKLNGVRAMLRARTRVLQLPRSELMDITEDWVDAAFCLEPKDIAYMERLVMLQNRHHAAGLRKAS